MLEGYSKIELQIEDEHYKKSVMEGILNYNNKFGLYITHPDGIKVGNFKCFEINREKTIGLLTKNDIKELDGHIYIRKEFKHCLLPDIVKIHAACYEIFKVVDGKKVGECLDLFGLHLDYDNDVKLRCVEVADEFESCPHFSCRINTNTFATHVNTLIKCPECHNDIVIEPKWICDPECESNGKYIFWLYTKDDADEDKINYEEIK